MFNKMIKWINMYYFNERSYKFIPSLIKFVIFNVNLNIISFSFKLNAKHNKLNLKIHFLFKVSVIWFKVLGI